LKHGIYSPVFSLQNAVCFIILTYLVPVLFTFYIQDVLKLKNNNSGAKRFKCEVQPIGVYKPLAGFPKRTFFLARGPFRVLTNNHGDVIENVRWSSCEVSFILVRC